MKGGGDGKLGEIGARLGKRRRYRHRQAQTFEHVARLLMSNSTLTRVMIQHLLKVL